LTISGTAETGASVQVYRDANKNGQLDDGELIATVTASSGAFSVDVGLGHGSHDIRAIQTDLAGNVSASSAALQITVDTGSPTNPTNLSVSGGGASRTFAWTAGADTGSGVWGYSWTLAEAGGTTRTGFATSTSVTLSGINNNRDYTFTVRTVDTAGNESGTATAAFKAPVGVAGEPINLGLDDLEAVALVQVQVLNLPEGWHLNAGERQADGTWLVQTGDVKALTVSTPASYAGAVVLDIEMKWTGTDGVSHSLRVANNVEAFAPGNPIIAWFGDDNLTGSSGADTFVLAQPMGAANIFNFDAAADKVNLLAFGDFSSFDDVLANLKDNAEGDAYLDLGKGQSIRILGVSASSLSAANFVFNQTPLVTNSRLMTLDNGSMLPLAGIFSNTGKVSLEANGHETLLQLIQPGLTLKGGGGIVLSDDSNNVISGTVSSVHLNNVDNTISGAGQLGAGSLTLTNGGMILANGTNALVINTGANAITNTGVMSATGLGGLTIMSGIVNTGSLWANGGAVTVHGKVVGAGEARISGDGSLSFKDASSATVIFEKLAAGTLTLGSAADFKGIIIGLDDNDKVDLSDITFGDGTTVSYHESATGTSGLLTVSDGVRTAQFQIVGDYDASSFKLSSNGAGGTLMTVLPNSDFSASHSMYSRDNIPSDEAAYHSFFDSHDAGHSDHAFFIAGHIFPTAVNEFWLG
jgi:hypothetical protein